jgi:Ni,Fe-hydrogenase III component G
MDTQEILDALCARFPQIEKDKAKSVPRRLYMPVPAEGFIDVLRFVAEGLGFKHLSTITGLDNGETFEVLYHVAREDGNVVTLKRFVPKDDPSVESVLPIYNGATFYEKELEGILGLKVIGLPEGRGYPLPENWPAGQYPLRKDWKPTPKEPVARGGAKNE